MGNNIGDKIKTLRQQIDMTQEELGNKIGVTKATIHKYEIGAIKNLRRPIIEKLAKALETTPAHLMGWTDNNLNTDIVGTNNAFINQNSGQIYQTQECCSKESQELLRVFNSLSVKERNNLINYAWALEEKNSSNDTDKNQNQKIEFHHQSS